MIRKTNNYLPRLEITVFLCGAVVMIMELVASRVVAPYFGNSLVVWTSIIGVILGSLSAGYHWGGKMADKSQSFHTLGQMLQLSALLTGVSVFLKEPALSRISFLFGGELRAASFSAVLLLFGPVSFILGLVSPYAARLKIKQLENSGRILGNLYALSTLGSIVGTFLAGFYLIPTFGNTVLLYSLAFVLLGISALVGQKISLGHLLTALLISALMYMTQGFGVFKLAVISDVDSSYNRILVRLAGPNSIPILTMGTDNSGIQSAMMVDNPDELYFEYAKAYAWSSIIDPQIEKALMIGGGGYSFPRYFLKHNLNAKLDVVEIDPKMTELARKYFSLKDDPRMSIFHSDARAFVNKSNDLYDVIFLDAFSSISPPSHLTTKEFMTDLKHRLSDDGFLMINLISAVTGSRSEFLTAERDTLLSVFPRVEVYPLRKSDPQRIQNLMIVAYMSPERTALSLATPITEFPNDSRKILTDDWSPVEYLTRNHYTR